MVERWKAFRNSTEKERSKFFAAALHSFFSVLAPTAADSATTSRPTSRRRALTLVTSALSGTLEG